MCKLKFILCCILFTITFSNSVFSQNQKGSQNLSAGIGVASNYMLGDYPKHEFDYIILKNPMVAYKVSVVDRTTSPAIHISYSYAINNRIMLGVTGVYESITGNFKQDNEIVGNYCHRYLTFALNGKYLYLNQPFYYLYGTVSLGSLVYFHKEAFPQALVSINSRSYHLNGFISPIGIRVGKQLGGYCELGYGYKGLINAGLNYQF